MVKETEKLLKNLENLETADRKLSEKLDDVNLQNAWNARNTALLQKNQANYTHILQKPLERDGQQYKTLSFNYSNLTGRDNLSIERDILAEFGKLVAVPEYTPEYLVNMAARACTERNEQGSPFVNVPLLLDLPLRDFKEICASARRFLQWSVSLSETEDDGSGKPA